MLMLQASAPSYFYPRPPRGGRRCQPRPGSRPDQFLSTPSARRATDVELELRLADLNFYPRPPRGGRLLESENSTTDVIFLSTPSARRATYASRRHRQHRANFYPRPPRGGRRAKSTAKSGPINFYPRPPRGGRHGAWWDSWDSGAISIHALREEGDSSISRTATTTAQFLSTPSARRATRLQQNRPQPCQISIHALREEGDAMTASTARHSGKISIHALREEGDACNVVQIQLDKISIHALREEGDAC
mgnify:CR=1 FL=1